MQEERAGLGDEDVQEEAPSGRSTRDRLIDVGVEALCELEPAHLVRLMGSREVARRAGTSSSTFFHHFASLDDYADAIMERVYDTSAMPLVEGTASAIDDVTQSELPFDAAVRFHDFEIRKLASDPHFRLRIGLWALGGASMDDRYSRFLRTTEARHFDRTRALWAHWGRTPAPPFDVAALAAATVSFLQGATIRWIVDPGNMTPERYRRLAPLLHMGVLRPIGDRRDVDDLLVELNWWPTQAPAKVPAVGNATTRDRIVAAAAARFAELEFEKVSVQSISRRAKVHVDTLYAYFDTKRALAVAVLAVGIAPQLEAAGAETTEDLRTVLEVVASSAAARPDLGEQLATDLVSRRPGTDTTVLVTTVEDRLAPLLDDAVGENADNRRTLARVILVDTVSRQLDKPSRPSPKVVHDVLVHHLPAIAHHDR